MKSRMLDKAIQLAVEKHAGQYDYQGQPYILHPMRVMMRGETDHERQVGILHDVGEDCYDSLTNFVADLEALGFDPEVIHALKALTHVRNESYEHYIMRVYAAGPLAIKVKLRDLEDNSRLDRISVKKFGLRDRDRAFKYRNAYLYLTDQIETFDENLGN
jgi:hypothetical protein